MSEREQFEAWCREEGIDPDKSTRTEVYSYPSARVAWRSWKASRRSALEEAAALIGPKGKRPCDCDTCDCGNSGDMRAVAWWDEAKSNADRIRALAASDSDGGKS